MRRSASTVSRGSVNAVSMAKNESRSTGSLIWLAFPQEMVTRLAALTGGRNVRLYKPKMVEGFTEKDRHGRTYLVEAIKGGLKATFLFKFKDGKVTFDESITSEKAQDSKGTDTPDQKTQPVQQDDGLGHDLEETEMPVECAAELDEDVPF